MGCLSTTECTYLSGSLHVNQHLRNARTRTLHDPYFLVVLHCSPKQVGHQHHEMVYNPCMDGVRSLHGPGRAAPKQKVANRASHLNPTYNMQAYDIIRPHRSNISIWYYKNAKLQIVI